MMEQGFTMQDSGVVTSTLVNHRDGWFVGGMLHTFPFGPPPKNLAGKEENTQFSPVLPKLFAGKGWTSGDRRWSLAGSLLPPVPVGGAAALIAGVEASTARPLGDALWGIEADFTFVRATAPVTASEEQISDAESKGYEDNVKTETVAKNCDADKGCIDVFGISNLSLRTGLSWELGDVWIPYAKVGLTVVSERLAVDYDQTSWSIFAIQPTLHTGTGIAVSDGVLLATGVSAGVKQGNQSAESAGIFYRLEGSAAVRF